MRFVVTVAGARHVVELDATTHDRHITLDGRELTVNARLIGPRRTRFADDAADHYGVLVGARSYEAYIRVPQGAADAHDGDAPTLEVIVGGRPYTVTAQDARAEAVASISAGVRVTGDATVRAPMPGLVRSVHVAPGDTVEHGQIIIVLEAMKMENDLAASRAGLVKAVAVATGQTVNQGDSLVTIGDSSAAPPETSEADE